MAHISKCCWLDPYHNGFDHVSWFHNWDRIQPTYGLCTQLRRDKWTGWEFNVNSPMKRGAIPCPCGGCESLINMGLKWI